jgi:BlaI family penicillinase repressor
MAGHKALHAPLLEESLFKKALTSAHDANIFAKGEKIRPAPRSIMTKPLPDLTRREGQIMEILFRRRRATVEEIRAELPDAPSPSSVRKLLDIMIERDLLRREYDGPRFVYFPVARPEEASRSALKQLVHTFFDNSTGSAMAALLDMTRTPLSDTEYKRLAAMLKQARGQGDER